MFKFTIRELLLLTVIMALATAWWIDHSQNRSKWEQCVIHFATKLAYAQDEAVQVALPDGTTTTIYPDRG